MTFGTSESFEKYLQAKKTLCALTCGKESYILQLCADEAILLARASLRLAIEQILVREPTLATAAASLETLWTDVYAWWIGALEGVSSGKRTRPGLREDAVSLLLGFVDEGIALYDLFLQIPNISRWECLLALGSLNLTRERVLRTSSRRSRAYSLYKEAVSEKPFDGSGYCGLARCCEMAGDDFGALYCFIIAMHVDYPSTDIKFAGLVQRMVQSPSIPLSFKLHRKLPPKSTASPSQTFMNPLIQMILHAILNQTTKVSHYRHLDQLARARLVISEKIDWPMIKPVLTLMWVVAGSETLFPSSAGNSRQPLTHAQCCLMSKLFQVYRECGLSLLGHMTPFAHNKFFFRLCGELDAISKSYPLYIERLDDFFDFLMQAQSNESVDSVNFVDLLVLQSFAEYRNDHALHGNVVAYLLDNFTSRNQIIVRLNSSPKGFVLKHTHERQLRITKSGKLLAHQLLSKEVEAAETDCAVLCLPWTAVDFDCLVGEFDLIKQMISERRGRFIITKTLLAQLDAIRHSQDHSKIREIGKFLYELMVRKDGCLRLFDDSNVNHRLDRREKKRIDALVKESVANFALTIKATVRFQCQQLGALRRLLEEEHVQIVCRSLAIYSNIFMSLAPFPDSRLLRSLVDMSK